MVHILITIKNCKLVLCNVVIVIMEAIIIVCNVINHARLVKIIVVIHVWLVQILVCILITIQILEFVLKIVLKGIIIFNIIVYNVIHHVIHARIHQISHARVALLKVHILISIKICTHVRFNVQMVIFKVTIIVCPVI